VRYISDLPNQGLESRVSVDVSLGWRFAETLEATFVVRNLNDRRHQEFDGLAIERSGYLKIAWTPANQR
jgi:outer membrane receptor protein involved in Fe transport